MNTKEELGKLLFDAITAISAVMSNVEFGKNDRVLTKANKFRKWLVAEQDKLNAYGDSQGMIK